METKLIIANWKMNPATAREAKKIFAGITKGAAKEKGVRVAVCPPFVFLPELARELKSTKVELGVQDLFYEDAGAFTGQISAPMVKPYKAKLAILGHSERRERGESNETVGRKVRYALASGLTPVVCVGERERSDDGAFYNFIREELDAACTGVKRADLAKVVIAYEPIWAIGKRAEEACQTSQLFEMVLFIRKVLTERFGRAPAQKVAILYGGSVKADNAAELMKDGGVDGLLVGSASLDSKEFSGIIRASLHTTH